jgi:hypothetical protein
MGNLQTRLPGIEEQRLVDAAVKAMKQAAANGEITVGGGSTPGADHGTLETLNDVSIIPLDGQLIFRSGIDWIALPIPADWASQRYVLGIAGGFPAWVPTADGVLAIGWGFNWGNNWGGS